MMSSTGEMGTVSRVSVDALIAGAVHLKPHVLRRDRHRVLQRCRGRAREQEGHVGLARGGGEHQVRVGPEQAGQAGGRDADGAGVAAAEQRHRLVTFAHVAQVTRHEAVALERFAVARKAQLVVGAAVDEVESDARQLAPRHAAQVLEVDGRLKVHGCGVRKVATTLSRACPQAMRAPLACFTY